MSNLSNIDQITSLHKNNELQLLCFRLAKEGNLYAINVFKIREVIKYTGDITKVSYSVNSLIEGLITIRDMTIPLIDLNKWFHYSTSKKDQDISAYAVKQESDEQIVMICDFSSHTVGVRIYEADRILSRKWTDMEQSGKMGGFDNNSKIVSRTRYFDGSLVQVVDVEKMLKDAFPWIEEKESSDIDSLSSVASDKVILVADDSPTVLKAMKHLLDQLHLKHIDFCNGQELMDYLLSLEDTSDIGMIITDLEMPVASGFEVIKQVKENKAFAHIPVIVNSSMSGTSNETMARSLKADEFLAKMNPEEIAKAVHKFLR